MAFINSYKPTVEPEISDIYGPEPYDVNFAFPFALSNLQTDRVKLIPFVPREHARFYADNTRDHPELWRWMPFDLSTPEILGLIEKFFRSNPTSIVFSIIDKTKPNAGHPDLGGCMAGVIGLINVSAQNLSTEIGPVLIFPQFQRTHVSTHAIAIALRYCLELPAASGLGLRRVQWSANPSNTASVRAAQRMGMKVEGQLRWNWVLGQDKEGKEPRNGDPMRGPGRDSMLLAICWDDWENGVREHVDRAVARIL